MTVQELRTLCAHHLLGCDTKDERPKHDQVQERLRGMNQADRQRLSADVDSLIAWLADYKAEEMLQHGRNA